jgi:hypothetical protein
VAELRPLFERARAGRDDELLQRLQRIAGNESWPQPARERILHAFALGLGDLPRVLSGATCSATCSPGSRGRGFRMPTMSGSACPVRRGTPRPGR